MLNRRQFIKLTAAALALISAGCFPRERKQSAKKTSRIPSANAWKFGIMSDSQWMGDDNGKNPASCAVEIINALNAEFIRHGVELVLQVGDLTDSGKEPFAVHNKSTDRTDVYSPSDAMGIRARYAQALYNSGIAFFPIRGNHDDSQITAIEFLKFFPQTAGGAQNDETAQRAAYEAFNPDASNLPDIKPEGKPFRLGTDFSSPSEVLKGLSYSFDHKNVRFITADQYTAPDGKEHTIRSQQGWITSRLKSKSEHAIVFTHKGLLTQHNRGILFGAEPSPSTPGQDGFIKAMADNGAQYLICGHDHMHDRSRVYTTDGETAYVNQLITASNSSKFYFPRRSSNDETFCGGKRQKLISQELFAIGYYIVTVDGGHMSFDYYSSVCRTADTIADTPYLTFSHKETFGYSLNGKNFLIEYGKPYTAVDVTSSGGTRAKILGGTNMRDAKDFAGRRFGVEVNTGFYPQDEATAGDMLLLRGMDFSTANTDIFTLSMSYAQDEPTLARLDSRGVWRNAADFNIGGVKQFIRGAWKPDYPLGTYGIDTASKTVWAVINTNGIFSPVIF